MQDDRKMIARHHTDRLEKDTKTSQGQVGAREVEVDPVSMLEEDRATLETLEPAVQVVERTKIGNGNSVS